MTNNQLTDEDLHTLIIELQQTAYRLNGTNSAYLMSDAIKPLRELQERRKINADLTMWVKRLGYSLRCAKPNSKLPRAAMAYLSAKGLVSVEDILR